VYAIAAREKWGYHADRLVFYNLQENTAVMTTRGPIQLEEAKIKVEEVAQRIKAGAFDPKPGYHCRLCPYRNVCPATEKPLHTASPAKKTATN
jgi:hypothetical protein